MKAWRCRGQEGGQVGCNCEIIGCYFSATDEEKTGESTSLSKILNSKEANTQLRYTSAVKLRSDIISKARVGT
jgi:hypothetical protein